MQIRGERTWCERCQAPEVFPENVPLVELFLDALPLYRVAGAMGPGVLMEGIDRGAMPGLMALHGIPEHERPAAWAAVRELESELRRVRAERAEEKR